MRRCLHKNIVGWVIASLIMLCFTASPAYAQKDQYRAPCFLCGGDMNKGRCSCPTCVKHGKYSQANGFGCPHCKRETAQRKRAEEAEAAKRKAEQDARDAKRKADAARRDAARADARRQKNDLKKPRDTAKFMEALLGLGEELGNGYTSTAARNVNGFAGKITTPGINIIGGIGEFTDSVIGQDYGWGGDSSGYGPGWTFRPGSDSGWSESWSSGAIDPFDMTSNSTRPRARSIVSGSGSLRTIEMEDTGERGFPTLRIPRLRVDLPSYSTSGGSYPRSSPTYYIPDYAAERARQAQIAHQLEMARIAREIEVAQERQRQEQLRRLEAERQAELQRFRKVQTSFSSLLPPSPAASELVSAWPSLDHRKSVNLGANADWKGWLDTERRWSALWGQVAPRIDYSKFDQPQPASNSEQPKVDYARFDEPAESKAEKPEGKADRWSKFDE